MEERLSTHTKMSNEKSCWYYMKYMKENTEEHGLFKFEIDLKYKQVPWFFCNAHTVCPKAKIQLISSIWTLVFSQLASIFHHISDLRCNHHDYICQFHESVWQLELKHFHSSAPFNRGQHRSTQYCLLFKFWATSEGRKDVPKKKQTFFFLACCLCVQFILMAKQ